MKRCVLFVVLLCFVSLFGCKQNIQTENETEYFYEPLTYEPVEPTHSELKKIRNKLGIISATFSGDYNCETDNAYHTLFYWDDLQDYYIPNYDDEITQYIAKPIHTNNGYVYWDKVIYEMTRLVNSKKYLQRFLMKTELLTKTAISDIVRKTEIFPPPDTV